MGRTCSVLLVLCVCVSWTASKGTRDVFVWLYDCEPATIDHLANLTLPFFSRTASSAGKDGVLLIVGAEKQCFQSD